MKTAHKGKRLLLQAWLHGHVGGLWVPAEMELGSRYYPSLARARSMAKAGNRVHFHNRFHVQEMAKKGVRAQ